eukprot:4100563-Amphidinium_carterae.1
MDATQVSENGLGANSQPYQRRRQLHFTRSKGASVGVVIPTTPHHGRAGNFCLCCFVEHGGDGRSLRTRLLQTTGSHVAGVLVD